jgi:hypothetical protein
MTQRAKRRSARERALAQEQALVWRLGPLRAQAQAQTRVPVSVQAQAQAQVQVPAQQPP